MKNLKSIPFASLLLFAFILILSSCQKEQVAEKDVDTPKLETEEQVFLPVNDEVKKKFNSLQYNGDEVLKELVKFPDGSVKEYYAIGDMLFSDEDLELQLMEAANDPEGKQYRTSSVVSHPDIITVRGVNSGGLALNAQAQTGLQWAINNYNALGLDLTFILTYGPFSGAADINVFTVTNPSGGGSAGFPSGGDPFPFARINSGTSGSTNVFEHIIGHEIGHCLGMRHSDWWCRTSCGGCNPESPATWIWGTAVGFESNSLFNACFSSGTNGEFNANDRDALRRVY
ncbi:MAG: M57 family metalloprotease [Bacteroidota bacterium]